MTVEELERAIARARQVIAHARSTIYQAEHDIEIAQTALARPSTPQAVANAHLIAAAPDLYAAAKEAAILLPSLPVDAIGVEHVIDLLNAALAKAVPGTDVRTSGTADDDR